MSKSQQLNKYIFGYKNFAEKLVVIENCDSCQTPLPPEDWHDYCHDCGSHYSKKNIDHLIDSSLAGGHFVCLHCGGVSKKHFGNFTQVILEFYAFRCDHTDCELNDNGKKLQQIYEDNLEEFKSYLLINQ